MRRPQIRVSKLMTEDMDDDLRLGSEERERKARWKHSNLVKPMKRRYMDFIEQNIHAVTSLERHQEMEDFEGSGGLGLGVPKHLVKPVKRRFVNFIAQNKHVAKSLERHKDAAYILKNRHLLRGTCNSVGSNQSIRI